MVLRNDGRSWGGSSEPDEVPPGSASATLKITITTTTTTYRRRIKLDCVETVEKFTEDKVSINSGACVHLRLSR